jgi:hypothetical protein
MARKQKTAVFETVALGGDGCSKVRTMDIQKRVRRMQFKLRIFLKMEQMTTTEETKACVLPLWLDSEQEQLGNQPD